MLKQITPAEVVLALRPLLGNTPRSPRTDKTPTRIVKANDVTAYLEDVFSRVTWSICSRCEREWNNLVPNTTICIDCFETDESNERRQIELGRYLQKTIGRYGIENYSFEKWDARPDNNYAFRCFKNFDYQSDNIYLYGGPGVGKTHLAGALLKDCASRNLRVKWINPMYLAMELTGRYPSDQKNIIDDLAAQDVVILDDLGLGEELRLTMKIIYMLTDKRKNDKRNGLVITSNLSLDSLAKNFRDDRITSRISGLCRVIKIGGTDQRANPQKDS